MTQESAVITIYNRHGSEGGEPPQITNADRFRSYGYFQNEHGDQWVFVDDPATGTATLRSGDARWGTVHTIRDPKDLPPAEHDRFGAGVGQLPAGGRRSSAWTRVGGRDRKRHLADRVMRRGVRTHVFQVEIERDEDGRWAATCPALPGCATYGATREEALKNIEEAVEAYVADLLASGEPIPAAREVIDAPAVSVVTP